MKTIEVNVLGGKLTVEVDDAQVSGGQVDIPTILPVISSTLGSPTSETVIPIQITFNYGVVNFTIDDVTVTGASKQNFVAVSSTVYTLEVIPFTDSETITINVPGGLASEEVNSDPASQFNIIHNSVDNEAPVVANATLSASSVTPSGFVAQFAKAQDNQTQQSSLVYRLYVSDSNNLTGTPAQVEANGALMQVGTDVTSLQASGLSPNTQHWYNIIVTDVSGNKTVYSPGTVTTAQSGTLTIMPFGDSLTNDSRGREQFWNQMVSSGYTIDFVGSQTQGSSIPDDDHEGVGGRTIAQGASVINGLLATYAPDYVLMLLGTNDFAWYFAQPNGATEAQVAQTIANNHQALTQQILNNAPNDVTVVVSTIPHMQPKNVGQAGGDRAVVVTELNTLIRDYVANMQGQGLKVELSDVAPLIDIVTDVNQYGLTGADLTDGVHLTSAGYTDLGNAYHSAMLDILAPVDTTPPVVAEPVLSLTNVGANGFTTEFTPAQDDISPSSQLTYRMYTSLSNNIGSVTLAEANGTLRAQGTGVLQLSTNALQAGTTYYVNIVVSDQQGNRSSYTSRSIITQSVDNTAPTVGDPAITVTNVGASSFVLNFNKAVDNVSPQSAIRYRAYVSTSNNISTPADALANGTPKSNALDVTQLSCSGLNPSTTYYFNVTAEDEAGNVLGYTSGSQATGSVTASEFVSTSATDFVVNGSPVKFYGTNAYYMPTYYQINPTLMNNVLDECQTLGMNLIRAWGFYNGAPQNANDITLQPNPGEYNESDLVHLDRAIAECKSRGIYVQLALVNFWTQLGGIDVYNTWAGEIAPNDFSTKMRLFMNGAQQQQWFRDYITMLLNRVNTITGIAYKDEPFIHSWEVGNELRNPIDFSSPAGAEIGDELRDYYQSIAQFIKSIDPNHMVTTGEEGFDEGQGGNNTDYQASRYDNTYWLRAQNGTSYLKNTAIPEIDFGQCHYYPDVFGLEEAFDSPTQSVVDQAKANQEAYIQDHLNVATANNKPCQVGEYGLVDWESADGYALKTLGYQHYYAVCEDNGLQSSLLWQYVPFGFKQGEFGGNIAYPGRNDDLQLYNDYQAHLDRIFGTVDTVDPVLPVDSTLTFSNVATNALTVSWNKATDAVTAQSGLRYRLYRSEANNITTPADCIANGTLVADQLDIATFNVTGLTQLTTYYFNVVVLDGAGNSVAYTPNSQQTASADAVAPVLPGDPTITASAEDNDGFTLTWNQSTDNVSTQGNLTYTPYTSLSNNISSVVDAEANGTAHTPVVGAGTTVINGLSSATLYYFNIVVSDQAGNKNIYTAGSTTTGASTPTINTGHAMATDLKAFWNFHEGSGNVVADILNGNNMQLDYSYDVNPAPWVTFGGQTCVEFAQGTPHVGAIPDGVDLQPATTGAGFTWALQFGYSESASGISSILDGGGNPNGISIIQRQWNDEFSFRIGSPAQTVVIPIKNDNALHTVIFTVDTSGVDWILHVYVDGVEVGTGYTLTAGGTFNNFDTHFWVGGGDYVDPAVRTDFTTWWRKMAHWHRPLTAQEALDFYNNPDLMLN